MPLVIPEQPKAEWFDALADTPAVAMTLETLEWLRAPDSPSLGKRTYNLETSPASPVYGPAEYDVLTGPDGPIARPTDPSGLNGQDNPEDREAKKAWIQSIITSEIHWHRSLGIPDNMTPEEYKAHDNCTDSLEGYWQPEDRCHYMGRYYEYNGYPENALDQLFMGNDLYLKDNTSEEYYTYDTDLTDHFSHLMYYTYNYDS